MLNSITIRRRAELRRARATAALLFLVAVGLGVTMLVGGLWCHCIPAVLVAPVAGIIARGARNRLRAVSRVLRILGA